MLNEKEQRKVVMAALMLEQLPRMDTALHARAREKSLKNFDSSWQYRKHVFGQAHLVWLRRHRAA